jgi:mannosyltransferase OCH1-like enzyme
MRTFKELMLCATNEDAIWPSIEYLFHTHYVDSSVTTQLIPRIIHQIWLGSEFPTKLHRLRNTWIAKHPNWQYHLWTDRDVASFGLTNKKMFDSAQNLGAKSDIFRYEILYRYGGLYIDTDFECFKPLDDMLRLEFFTGCGTSEAIWFNGLFACRPNHPILEYLILRLAYNNSSNWDEIMRMTGPGFFTQAVNAYIHTHPDTPLVVFPSAFFYPVKNDIRFQIREDTPASREIVKQYLHPESHCAHLWYCSWQ